MSSEKVENPAPPHALDYEFFSGGGKIEWLEG